MNKIFKFLSLGIIVFSLAGCGKSDKGEFTSELNNSSNIFESSKVETKLTTNDVYNYIRDNNVENVNKTFITSLMGHLLDFNNNATNKATYDLKIKKHFEENYLNSDEYKVNGEFDEDLLASTLESQLYVVDKVNKPTSGPTVELGLKYNYSDYINRGVNYDVYLEIIKGQYILNEKPSILDNSKTRIISIYKSDDLDELQVIVEDMFEGKYDSLDEITQSKKDEEIEELGRQYCVNLGYENEYYKGTCSASTSSSTYDSALYKFTVCENGVRCKPLDGLYYQVGLIQKKKYVEEKVVNKDTTDILYPEALGQLFRSNVKDYLHNVIEGEDPFLADWLYNYNKEFSHRDIILTAGPDKDAYLVTVRVVDSKTTSLEDKEKALSLLLDKVNDTSALLSFLENVDVEITDPEILKFYNSLLGK